MIAAAALAVFAASSCATKSDYEFHPPGAFTRFDEPKSRVNPEQATKDATLDIETGNLTICRYDILPIGGYRGDYFEILKRFGLKEAFWPDATLAYARSYNRVIDRELRRKHGLRYLAVRSRIMPMKNAVPWYEKS